MRTKMPLPKAMPLKRRRPIRALILRCFLHRSARFLTMPVRPQIRKSGLAKPLLLKKSQSPNGVRGAPNPPMMAMKRWPQRAKARQTSDAPPKRLGDGARLA